MSYNKKIIENNMIKHKFQVKGMHCASCAHNIEERLKTLKGVSEYKLNLVSNELELSYDPNEISLEQINHSLEEIGYSLIKLVADQADLSLASKQKKQDLVYKYKVLFFFVIASIVFLYMLAVMLSQFFPTLPTLTLAESKLNSSLFILATLILLAFGSSYYKGIIQFLRHRVASMDTLIGIGTFTAYLYSLLVIFLPHLVAKLGLPTTTYFDAVIVVIGFVGFGRYLENRSRHKTGEAISHLVELQAKTALVIKGEQEVEVKIEEIVLGDIVVVKPGMKVPLDGEIISGSTSIDEAMISGESLPVDKKVGDKVIGGTLNQQGSIRFRVEKIGNDTLLAQIINLVDSAQVSKAPIQARADQISAVFVPIVLIIAGISLVAWLAIGIPTLGLNQALSSAIYSFVAVLVIACPCALGLATPTAMIVGIGKGASSGILIKEASSLEFLSQVNTVVVDKTGTITTGKPELSDVLVLDNKLTKNDVIQYAASIEALSEHPLAQAIVRSAQAKNLDLIPVTDFSSEQGLGVKAKIKGEAISIHKPLATEKPDQVISLEQQGKTVVELTLADKVIAYLALSDQIKAEAAKAIAQIQKLGIKTIMISGDNQLASLYIGSQVGISEVYANMLPAQKAQKIKELQANNRTIAMTGDGINDAPALVQADVGIALATGSDIAIESADITLLQGDISRLVKVIKLSQATIKTVKQNLFWAFFYNAISLPVAAGLLYPLWGFILNPMFAGLAMALSSVSVVANSLRLKGKRL